MADRKTTSDLEEKDPPVAEVRMGRIKGSIWRNRSKIGVRYSVTYSRVYRVDETERSGPNDKGWRESVSFGRDDNLVLAEVARKAACWIYDQAAAASKRERVADVKSPEDIPF